MQNILSHVKIRKDNSYKGGILLKQKKWFIIAGIVILLILIILLAVWFAKRNKTTENTTDLYRTSENVHNPLSDATVSNGKWPTTGLMAKIPAITVGTVGDVVENTAGTSVSVYNITLSDYQNYIAQVQKAGFNQNEKSTSTSNSILYSSSNAEGISLKTSYSTETQKMSLVIQNADNTASTNNINSNTSNTSTNTTMKNK